jgi:tRNA A37 threonylcarbamoyladenosine modification protein TsaB
MVKKIKAVPDSKKGLVFIDSTEFQSVFFAFVPLDDHKKIVQKKYDLHKGSFETAKYLNKFLSLAVKDKLELISSLVVSTGVGSFAGIRSGVALALGMSLVLDIPVYVADAKVFKKYDLEKFEVFLSVLAKKPSKAGAKKINTTASINIDYGAKPNIGIEKKKKLKQIH